MFKTQKKPYLKKEHKQKRLKWARAHCDWMVENWMNVIWMDEAIFEVSLDTHFCYITCQKGKALKDQYLKPTFKSE